MSGNSNKCVHTEHCCRIHGCKYGDKNCPVYLGYKCQSFLCEQCSDPFDESICESLTLKDLPKVRFDEFKRRRSLKLIMKASETQAFIDYMKKNLPDINWHSAILENGEVREVHFAEAIVWACEQPEETFHVDKTIIGDWEFSTIFSINNLTGNPDYPKHFETMAFYNGKKTNRGRYFSEVHNRYETLEEAKIGHKRVCYLYRQQQETKSHD